MSTKRHKAYNTVKLLIEANQITEFRQIFEHMPKTVINKDLGLNYQRFNNLLSKVQGFKLEELYALGHLIGVDEKTMVDLAHNQYLADKKSIRKK